MSRELEKAAKIALDSLEKAPIRSIMQRRAMNLLREALGPEPTQGEGWRLREVYFHADGEPGMHREPAPRPEFVRLSEEEVTEILTSAYDMYAAICAVENRLAEKNRG